MRKSTILFAILVATAAAPSSAANWVRHGSSTSGAGVFIDSASIIRNGGVIGVWIKFDNSTLTARKPTDPTKVLNHFEFKCLTKELRITDAVEYDAQGGNTATEGSPATPFRPFIPDSIGEEVGRFVCEIYEKPATKK